MELVTSTIDVANMSSRDLADFIRAVHFNLRKKCQQGQDARLVWAAHCEDTARLRSYAVVMHALATQHWDKRVQDRGNPCRIAWVYSAIIDYFSKGGKERAEDKEHRKAYYMMPHLVAPDRVAILLNESSAGVTQHSKVDDALNKILAIQTPQSDSPLPQEIKQTGHSHIEEFISTSSQEIEANVQQFLPKCVGEGGLKNSSQEGQNDLVAPHHTKINNHIAERLEVLDVGSCYNAFSRYEDLCVTAVDLMPATPDVHRCDFLNLKVVQRGDDDSGLEDVLVGVCDNKEKGKCNSKKLDYLPSSSFDVVIFSLFLEYIPDPAQRLQCCKQAYDLLNIGGILVIVTPDSKHVGCNHFLYRLWQIALAEVGFMRVKYEKTEHFHGMAFRKVLYKQVWEKEADLLLEKTKLKCEDLLKVRKKAKNTGRPQLEDMDLTNILQEMLIPQDLNNDENEENKLKEISVQLNKIQEVKNKKEITEFEKCTKRPKLK